MNIFFNGESFSNIKNTSKETSMNMDSLKGKQTYSDSTLREDILGFTSLEKKTKSLSSLNSFHDFGSFLN